ncbi:hypothetical protein ACFLWV_04090, partial [Chloroflexota bacterium]
MAVGVAAFGEKTKMKIKPFTVLLLIMVSVLAVYVFLGITYVRQQREQDMLTSQLAQLSSAVQNGDRSTDELEQQLSDAEARLASEQV